jgi:hypothetical protein
MAGHLFVTQGDLTRLACDAWLLPTDRTGRVSAGWLAADGSLGPIIDRLPDAVRELNLRRAAVCGRVREDGPELIAIDTGGVGGEKGSWYADAIRAGIRLATKKRPRNNRERVLIGVPFAGVGAGGAADAKGDVLLAVLRMITHELRDATESFDVAFVTFHDVQLAAAEQARRQVARDDNQEWSELTAAELALSGRLAQLARQRQLVLFVGAGVSQAAGLPGWNDLLAQLTSGTAVDPEAEEFSGLDALDKARVVRRALGDERYGARMREIFTAREQSLGHQILAALPVTEVATTNYDTLFEDAWRCVGRKAAVLPAQSAAGSARWLLKLHGSVSRPDQMVLSRDDYLRFDRRGAAVSGVVHAMLMTRHMLFVGFSLSDDHFHRIVHDVREAMGAREDRPGGTVFGTALSPTPSSYAQMLWQEDIDMVDLSHDENGPAPRRRIEIFLDRLLSDANDAGRHLMDPTFDALWTEDERQLRRALQVARELADAPDVGDVGESVRTAMQTLGASE